MQLRRKPIAAAITGGITDGLTGPIVGAAASASNDPLWTQDFSTAQLIPGATHARASTQLVETDTGALYEVPVDAIPIRGARPVRSLVKDVVPTAESTSFSAWTAVNTASISGDGLTVSLPAASDNIRLDVSTDGVQNGRTYAASFWLTGNGTLTLRVRDRFGAGPDDIGDQVVTLTSTPQRFSVAHQFSDDQTNGIRVYLLRGASDTATEAVLQSPGYLIQEITHRAALSTAPDEFIDPDTDYGTGVAGFRYFLTALANSVDASGVVTEGTGAALPNIVFDWQAGERNLHPNSADPTWINCHSSVLDIVLGGVPSGKYDHVIPTAGGLLNNRNGNRSSQSVAATAGQYYCGSVYAKVGEYDQISLYFAGEAHGVHFNLADGSVNSEYTAYPESYGSELLFDGWYRFWIATAADDTTITFEVSVGDSVDTTADGTSGIQVTGQQVETGTLPTAYIPTSGAALPRAAYTLDFSGVTGFITPNETRIVCTGLGPNLVTNGTFDSDLTGWTAMANASAEWESGRAKVTTTASNVGITQTIDTEIGTAYCLIGSVDLSTSVEARATIINDGAFVNDILTADGIGVVQFVAEATSVEIRLRNGSSSGVVYFDNIYVHKITPTDTTERTIDVDNWDGTDLSDILPHANIVSVTQYAPGDRP